MSPILISRPSEANQYWRVFKNFETLVVLLGGGCNLGPYKCDFQHSGVEILLIFDQDETSCVRPKNITKGLFFSQFNSTKLENALVS